MVNLNLFRKPSLRLGFSHRTNPDGTIDSICRGCFHTIAKSQWEAALEKAEQEHTCNVADLRRLKNEAREH